MKFKSMSLLLLTALCAYSVSCGDSAEQASVQENKDFYPVSAHIHSELALIDSLPVAVFLYRDEEGRKDTSIVDKQVFRAFAEAIPQPDITREPLKKSYTESVYMDATLNLVTMSYTPKTESGEIRKIDVYINPDTENVKRIYVEKRLSGGDSTIVRKIVWTSGQQLQVTSLVTREGQQEKVIQEKYSWGMQ
jgi:hypothetical protein